MVGKLAFASAVFVAIVGGYLGVLDARAAAREAAATLPGAGPADGRCTLWFIGSSTIFRWSSLPHDMRPWRARNRGVNGAMISQIVLRLRNEPPGPPPAAIVFYAGENDIAGGASVADTIAAFRRFLAAKTRRYGPLPVIAISLKPSPTRWPDLQKQTAFNDAVRCLAARRDDLRFVDIRPAMLVDGRPGPFYVGDGIHMNSVGYARWTAILRPALTRLLPTGAAASCAAARTRA